MVIILRKTAANVRPPLRPVVIVSREPRPLFGRDRTRRGE